MAARLCGSVDPPPASVGVAADAGKLIADRVENGKPSGEIGDCLVVIPYGFIGGAFFVTGLPGTSSLPPEPRTDAATMTSEPGIMVL
jgi:hypothetical protein